MFVYNEIRFYGKRQGNLPLGNNDYFLSPFSLFFDNPINGASKPHITWIWFMFPERKRVGD